MLLACGRWLLARSSRGEIPHAQQMHVQPVPRSSERWYPKQCKIAEGGQRWLTCPTCRVCLSVALSLNRTCHACMHYANVSDSANKGQRSHANMCQPSGRSVRGSSTAHSMFAYMICPRPPTGCVPVAKLLATRKPILLHFASSTDVDDMMQGNATRMQPPAGLCSGPNITWAARIGHYTYGEREAQGLR